MDSPQVENISEGTPASDGGWPQVRMRTEDSAVNSAVAALEKIPELPTAEHHTVYTALHDRLLAELNAEPPEES